MTIDRHRDGGVASFASHKSVWDVNFTVCGDELRSFTVIDRISGEFYRVSRPYSLPETAIISSRILSNTCH